MTKAGVIKFVKLVSGMLMLSLAIGMLIPEASILFKYAILMLFVFGNQLVNRNL